VRTESGIDLFSKPTEPEPILAHGTPPRGLTEDGWVRTTGWLQVGDHPVSSASVAAVAGLLWASVGAAVLVREFPVIAGVLVLTAPVLCGVAWWLFTSRVRPASTARNIETRSADDLVPGDLVRVYGSIGPVAQVAEVTFAGDDVSVAFHGGLDRSWPREHVVHVVELLS
jgi:hypothetical protein